MSTQPDANRYLSDDNASARGVSNSLSQTKGFDMKRILVFALLTTFLGGCMIVPLGHGYRDRYDGYSRGHGYYDGDGYHRDDGYYPGYGQRSNGYHDRGR
jgi:hypothetical protein